jgi:hypothetical protein
MTIRKYDLLNVARQDLYIRELAKVTPIEQHGWLWTIAHALRLA